MESVAAYEQFVAGVLACPRGPTSGQPCPLWRIHDAGYFPKFGAGSADHPRIAIVTLNPGRPSGMQNGLADPSVHLMRATYESELLLYLEGDRGAAVNLLREFERVGLDFQRHGYFTEAYKCVGGKGPVAVSVALDHCSQYLAQELALVRPKSIITLGGLAFQAVKQAVTGVAGRNVKVPPVCSYWHDGEPITMGEFLVVPIMHNSKENRACRPDFPKALRKALEALAGS